MTVALAALGRGERFPAAADAVVSPTYVPDLVDATLDLLIDGESGVWHLANEGETTWADFARVAATKAGLDPAAVEARPSAALGFSARRPAYSVLSSERGRLLPKLDDALCRYIRGRGLSA